MQLLTKFKKILYMEFRATLNFQKKNKKKKFTMLFLKYKRLRTFTPKFSNIDFFPENFTIER